jgi:hypothetical protein
LTREYGFGIKSRKFKQNQIKSEKEEKNAKKPEGLHID